MRRLWPRLLVVLGVLAGVHVYIWSQLVAPLPSPARGLGTVALLLLAPSLPLTAAIARTLPRAAARPWLLVGYLWFGLGTYLLLGAALAQVLRALGVAPAVAGGVALGAALVTVLYGLRHVRRGPQVRHVRVALPGLGAPQLRVVQLTDVHIGPLLGADFARDVVAKVNALAPDVVVITGDFVDGPLDELRPHVAPFAELRAPLGVFAVTGNHEYYWRPEPWLAHLRGLGITVLRNQHVRLADALVLAGVDDATAGEDVPAALAGRDPALPVVLLAHHPSTIHRAAAAGVHLQLSGHTHGGQLLPLGWLCRLFEPLAAGLARFGDTWLYVSEGTGFWGPPMRVGTTQEITALTLVPA